MSYDHDPEKDLTKRLTMLLDSNCGDVVVRLKDGTTVNVLSPLLKRVPTLFARVVGGRVLDLSDHEVRLVRQVLAHLYYGDNTTVINTHHGYPPWGDDYDRRYMEYMLDLVRLVCLFAQWDLPYRQILREIPGGLTSSSYLVCKFLLRVRDLGLGAEDLARIELRVLESWTYAVWSWDFGCDAREYKDDVNDKILRTLSLDYGVSLPPEIVRIREMVAQFEKHFEEHELQRVVEVCVDCVDCRRCARLRLTPTRPDDDEHVGRMFRDVPGVLTVQREGPSYELHFASDRTPMRALCDFVLERHEFLEGWTWYNRTREETDRATYTVCACGADQASRHAVLERITWRGFLGS